MMFWRTIVAGLVWVSMWVLPLQAHEVQPGYLELQETMPGRYEILWKVPRRGGMHLRLTPVLPENCSALTPVASYRTTDASVQRWTVACEGELAGGRIAVTGLENTITDVLVQILPLDGGPLTIRLKPGSPSFTIPMAPSMWETASTYLFLGVEHMLEGIDHLLFVLALLLIVKGRWQLLKAVTSFTVAHSVTLAGATLGFVHAPTKPVEAVIALSIVFLAGELAQGRMGRPGLTCRHPWIVALIFGLLHGFGFAGALADVGLPQGQIPLALFQFNLGVELGQLIFIAGAVIVMAGLARLPVQQPTWIWRVPAYSIGAVAAFWTVERVASFW